MEQAITEEVLESYIANKDDLLSYCQNKPDHFRDLLFEAIVDQNPSFEIQKLAERFISSSYTDPERFAEKQWEKVIGQLPTTEVKGLPLVKGFSPNDHTVVG